MAAECPLRRAARTWPDHCAVSHGVQRVTFAELDCRADNAAGGLASRHVGPGDVVAVLCPNSIDTLVALFGILRCGALVCPLPTRYPDALLVEITRRLNPQRILAATSFASLELPGVVDLSELIVSTQERSAPPPASSPDQPATLILTSGSMGKPKVVVHSLRNHLTAAAASNERVPLHSEDRWLWSLPWYHVGGMAILFRCMQAGATVVVTDPTADLAHEIADQSITHVSVVSTQLHRMVGRPSPDLPALRALLCGGSDMPTMLVRQALQKRLPVYLSYGLTEFGSQVCTATPDQVRLRPEQCGLPLSHSQVKIEQNGELLIRGDSCCLGYWENKSITPLPVTDGWFHTGDTAVVAEDGSVTVTGRLDNRFVSAGVNIVPEEIEQALLGLPGIAQALVVPVPDAEYLNHPVAFVEATGEFDEGMLLEQLRRGLPRIKIPVRLFPWPDAFAPDQKPFRPEFTQLAERLMREAGGQ